MDFLTLYIIGLVVGALAPKLFRIKFSSGNAGIYGVLLFLWPVLILFTPVTLPVLVLYVVYLLSRRLFFDS